LQQRGLLGGFQAQANALPFGGGQDPLGHAAGCVRNVHMLTPSLWKYSAGEMGSGAI